MIIVHNITKLKEELQKNKKDVSLVPTMGFLHQGHLSLIAKAKKTKNFVIITIFVNPMQFDRKEDFDKYPKDLVRDIEILEEEKIDLLFIPEKQELYPEDFVSFVEIRNISNKLCGKTRGDHFLGVATIVTKLFNLTKPQKAFFGLKDYQQFFLIKQLTKDLNFDVEIIAVETIREKTGLAISSRNARLSQEEKEKIAPEIFKTLQEIARKIKKGGDKEKILEQGKQALLAKKITDIDYLEILNNDFTVYNGEKKARVFIAVFIKNVRLIDNLEI